MNKKREKVLWNIKDILSSTRVTRMTLEQEGAYRRALDIFYLNGFLPADVQEIANTIGKGCSMETAQVVRAMFTQDPKYPALLTHDYLLKMMDGDATEINIMYETDEKKKDKFKKYCQTLKNDEYIRIASNKGRSLDQQTFEAVVDEFIAFKIATGQYKSYANTNDIRRNLLYFIPYSNIIKKLESDGKPYANPKSATSKIANW